MRAFRIFFCHRTQDRNQVEALQAELRTAFAHLTFEDSSAQVPHEANWQQHAQPLIAQADLVVCVVGASTHLSDPVGWELQQALASGRPVLVRRLGEQCKVPALIAQLPAPLWQVAEVARDVMAALMPIALMPGPTAGQEDRILVQYNTMVTSWEALVNRRQTVNSFYMSACAALLTALGVLLSLSKDLPGFNLALGVLILAVVGGVIAHAWHTTLTAYGTLSAAKAQVVTTLEQRLPVRLFDAEWQALQSRRYTSTTRMDQRIARVFLWLFVATVALTLAWGLQTLPLRVSCPPPTAHTAPAGSQPASSALPAASVPTP